MVLNMSPSHKYMQIMVIIVTIILLIVAAEATNLFLRENGQEVLKVMEPQLKRKLSVLFAGIVNQLLRHVPVEVFLLP